MAAGLNDAALVERQRAEAACAEAPAAAGKTEFHFFNGGDAAEGVYRPWRNCLMNNLHKTDEFCPVCSKAIVDYIDFLCK